MATTVTGGNLTSLSGAGGAMVRPASSVSIRRRRLVPQEAGRAIEMLGHAIEYLADEFVLDCMDVANENRLAGKCQVAEEHRGVPPQLQAIELLMARNREIYFSCPVAPTLVERLSLWFHQRRA
jgi:hypothetical protein